jgi:chromosome segregation ATPase
MSDLNHLITSQRQTEERDYLQRFHQEEIAVIREIADSHEKGLKNEIKKLSQELMELNGTVERNIETMHQLRREGRKLEGENERLREEVGALQGLVVQGEERQQLSL